MARKSHTMNDRPWKYRLRRLPGTMNTETKDNPRSIVTTTQDESYAAPLNAHLAKHRTNMCSKYTVNAFIVAMPMHLEIFLIILFVRLQITFEGNG